MFTLNPVYDSRQSFYHKAQVDINKNILTLYSYNTKVAWIDKTKNKAYVIETYSATTLRHIKDFLYQNSFNIGNKKFIEKNYMQEVK